MSRHLSDASTIWRLRRLISRVALAAATSLLVAGLGLVALGYDAASVTSLGWACALLVFVPTLNVLAVLAQEIRARDWPFAAAALAVVLLIGYAVVTRTLLRD